VLVRPDFGTGEPIAAEIFNVGMHEDNNENVLIIRQLTSNCDGLVLVEL
jgi:hypothetical protein